MEKEICKTCGDSGWIRPNEDLEFYEDGFGQLEPCPSCRKEDNKAFHEQAEPEEREPDPTARQFDLRWIDYTE